MCGGVDKYFHAFLTSAKLHSAAALTHCLGLSMGPRNVTKAVEKMKI
jgi:hypothetical protein